MYPPYQPTIGHLEVLQPGCVPEEQQGQLDYVSAQPQLPASPSPTARTAPQQGLASAYWLDEWWCWPIKGS